MKKQTNSHFIHQATSIITRLFMINLIWFLFNLPIVMVTLPMLVVKEATELYSFILPALICIILLLFPATSAMFSLVKDFVLKIEANQNILCQFCSTYKRLYKRSIVGGLLFTSVWILIFIDFILFFDMRILVYIFIFVSAIVFTITVNFFSVLVYEEDRLLTVLKKASLLTFSRPLLIPVIVLGNILILYVSVNLFQFLVLICTGSGFGLFSFYTFYRLHIRAN